MQGSELEQAIAEARTKPIVPRPHPYRALAALLSLLMVVWMLVIVLRNPAFEWEIVAQYFFHPNVIGGLITTLWLTGLITAFSVLLGVVVAAARLSANYVLQSGAWFYIWIFRSTPLLVQLLFWFNIGYLFPRIGFGLPWGEPFFSIDSRDLIGTMTAALLGLTLHNTAYAAEIIRGGIAGVPHGQVEAAQVLGISPLRVFMRIVLPQSMRSIIPSIGNQLIDTLKATSVLSVLAVPNLLYSVQLIYNRNYKIVPLLMVATLWYIIVTSLLSCIQYYIEQYYARGVSRRSLPPLLQQLRAILRRPFSSAYDLPILDQSSSNGDARAAASKL